MECILLLDSCKIRVLTALTSFYTRDVHRFFSLFLEFVGQLKLMLESPDDIFCFKFCPSDPNIIAGGCINGQVLMNIFSYSLM